MIKTLFVEHLQTRLIEIEKILSQHNIDHLLIETGHPPYQFLDDQTVSFRPNPHFNYLCPDQGPGHILKITPQKKPVLYYYSPQDFWHESSVLTQSFWEESFEIIPFEDVEKLWDNTLSQNNSQTVVISPDPEQAIERGCQDFSSALLTELHQLRVSKTNYEIENLKRASALAAQGHQAAHQAFLLGQSEFEIFCSYLIASNHREMDLPYAPIIALNQKASVLHYQNLRRERGGLSFLIDAGAKQHGYCADVTRTYAAEKAHSVFKALLKSLNEIQKKLCLMVRPGDDYYDIQQKTHLEITKLILDSQIARGSLEELQAHKISHSFFPHGVGHALGLQVHDVGGKPKNIKDDLYPYLRTLRKIEINDVLTVEPGIYFIPMLLNELKSDSKKSHFINWKLIDELIPLGGIRIEDNVVATLNGPYNLTREFLKDF